VSSIEAVRRISGMFGITVWQWATLVMLGLMFAMSEGLGIGMLVPVLSFAEDGTIPTEGLGGERAPGVANFKRWTGAHEVQWLGEWEWSSPPVLRRAVNLMVRHRPDAPVP